MVDLMNKYLGDFIENGATQPQTVSGTADAAPEPTPLAATVVGWGPPAKAPPPNVVNAAAAKAAQPAALLRGALPEGMINSQGGNHALARCEQLEYLEKILFLWKLSGLLTWPLRRLTTNCFERRS